MSIIKKLHKMVPTSGKVLAFFIPLVLWGLWWAYSGMGYMFSTTEWPEISSPVRTEIVEVKAHPAFNNPDASDSSKEELENLKGRVLVLAIVSRLEAELADGWTPQYLFVNPKSHFDNAVNRKLGVLTATTLLQKFFSTTMAKYGSMDPENPWMQEARERDFTYGPRTWGFFERSSSSAYDDGVANVHKYADKLIGMKVAGKQKKDTRAIVNIKASEIYEMLTFILSKNFIDVPLGWLSAPGDSLTGSELDDRVYFAQGMTLVLRDVITVLQELYPEKITNVDKGGTQNLEEAMAAMNKICTFNPAVVLRGKEDSMFADHRGKMARYMFTVRERLLDVSETIRR
ncbi:hypothetical protein [Maridesulfovibrio ferrireducens]|uniref:hypothetical protein n=1 Tax=Maridesulfovibrio ferrireducens TaxID=246191 RepID=UPI001A2BD266|nr:hypothetical protein [Maridesulfovibrio ferrireducens]MBI9110585.1 hypothetical protein [Maridesulfovibrio ferrireducens]